MKYLLACQQDGRTLFLDNVNGSLTPHKEQARVFLSRSNAEDENAKRQRRKKDLRGPKLFAWPLREETT